MPIDADELHDALDAHQLAVALRVSLRSARRKIQHREIEHIRIGRTAYVPRRALRDYLERQRIKAVANEPPTRRKSA